MIIVSQNLLFHIFSSLFNVRTSKDQNKLTFHLGMFRLSDIQMYCITSINRKALTTHHPYFQSLRRTAFLRRQFRNKASALRNDSRMSSRNAAQYTGSI